MVVVTNLATAFYFAAFIEVGFDRDAHPSDFNSPQLHTTALALLLLHSVEL